MVTNRWSRGQKMFSTPRRRLSGSPQVATGSGFIKYEMFVFSWLEEIERDGASVSKKY